MAKARRSDAVRLLGFARRSRAGLMMSTALQTASVLVLAHPAHAQPAPNARPAGGTVVAGSASISRTPANTQINQSSQRAAIDWRSFDVGAQQSVTFAQPSASAVALNRVTGPDPSQIAGRIDANGQFILVNQSGVTFYKGAQVNAAGVMVSAANITNQNFMAGRLTFDQAGRNPNARIDNRGSITVREAGLAALVAPQVANSGVITARLGHVVLAGAKTATLDLYGDGLLSLDVSNQVTQAPVGADGKAATALVTNTGVIVADGGTVQLTARAADGLVQTLVQAGGTIQAASVGARTGVVALSGVGGSVVVEGQLSAPGSAPGTTGGAVQVVADHDVTVAASARIDASGQAGGGVVAIGTTLNRARDTKAAAAMTAANTTIQAGARVSANAAGKGDGGRVVVLSKAATRMEGQIAARGGPQGGNGGFAETSGGFLKLTGSADESAPAGRIGTLLLDPTNLNIVLTSPAGTNIDGEFAGNTLPSGAADAATTPSTITTGKLAALGATGDVTVQATGTIDVQNSVTVANGLLLQATGDLLVDRGVTIKSSAHTLELDAGFNFGNSKFDQPGAILLGTTGTGTAPQLQAVNLTLHAGTGINLNDTVLTAIAVTDLSTAAGGVSQAAAGTLTTSTLRSTAGVTGSASLTATTNAVGTLGVFGVTGGDFSLVNNGNTGNLAVTGPVAATNVSISNANSGTITVGGTVTATIGTLALSSGSGGIALNPGHVVSGGIVDLSASGGGVAQAAGTVTANVLQSGSHVAGNVSLQQTTNAIDSVGNFSVVNGGSFSLADSHALTVTGTIQSPSDIFLRTSHANGIIIANTGVVAAGAASRAAFQAAKLAINLGGTVTGGTFEFAPDAAGALTLGTGGDLASLAGIGTDNAVIGLVTAGGALVPTATAINTVGTFDGNALPVALRTTGTIGEAAASPIVNVTTLTGGATAVKLDAANDIRNVGSFAASSGDFTLNDSGVAGGTLTVSGPLTGANVSLSNAPTIGVTGNIGATGTASLSATAIDLSNGAAVTGSTVALTAGAGGISLTGNAAIGQTGGTVDINSGGILSEAANSVITAGTLESTGGITGDVALLGSANAIANLGQFAVTGNLALLDGINLTVGGAVSVTGPARQLSLQGPSIAVAAGGTLSADAGSGLLSLQTDSFANAGAISAATVELAPRTPGLAMTLGAAGGLSLASLSGFTTGNLILGAVTPPGGSRATTAGSITIGGAFDTTGVSIVSLNATGAVTQSAALTGGSQLFGTASSFVLLDNANQFGAVGLTAKSGDILVRDALPVTAAANAAAGNFYLASPGVTLTGAISAGGILSLQTDSFTFVAGSLSGTTVELAPLTAGLTETLGAAGGLSLLDSAIVTGNLRIGAVTEPVAGLTTTAGSVVIGGTFGSSGLSLELDSLGSVSQALGAILTAGTLSGSAGSNVALATNVNAVASLGTFTASGFTLDDGIGLTVSGAVNGGPSVTVQDTGTLTVASGGSVTASAVSLTANDIAIAGLVSDGGGGTTSLIATTGTISETGTLVAGTLSGSSAGTTSLTGATSTTNQIADLGTFTAQGFTLDDGIGLTVSGVLNGGPSATVLDAGTLTIGNTVTAAAIALTADSISIPGLVSDGGGGTTSLIATTGTISETGTLVAGTLSGSSAGTTSLSGATSTTNQIASLGTFTAQGFTLDDGIGLTVSGVLNGGPSATVQDTGTLTIASGGSVTASAVSLTANDIAIAGLVSDGGGGTTSLIATTGTISENGTLVAGTLSGSSAGTTSLTGATSTTNQIANLGTFTAQGFTLDDGIGLTVSGVLNGGPSATVLDAGTLTIGNTVTAAAIALTADSISIPGLVSDGGGGTTSLIATTGTISETGTLVAGTLSGSSAGTTSLSGATSTTNQIASLGTFTAQGFTLDDGIGLTVSGVLNGGPSATVLDAGTLTIGNTVTAAEIALTADSISIPGLVSDGGAGTTSLIATTGTISETGTLIAGTLSGSSAGTTSLTGATSTTNQIASLGTFTAQGFTLADGIGLTVSGAVNGGPSVTVQDTGTLTIASGGSVTASAVSLTANDIAIAGLVSDGGGGTTSLIATTGTISETGTLVAGTLSGSSAGTTSLSGATSTTNQIANLGTFTAQGFTLDDGIGLTVSGVLNGGPSVTVLDAGTLTIGNAVTAAAIALTGGNIAIPGLVTDGGAGTTSLIATTGTISETGTLVAGTLSGSSAGTTSLSGATSTTNQIASLGTFTAQGFTLADGIGLTVSGAVNGGPSVTVLDAGTLTVASGGSVTASAVSLTANDIAIAGLVSDGGGGTISLIATTGTISETGTLIAGTLSGSSAGTTSLSGATSTTNQIASLGTFTASGFTLDDGIGLTVSGAVNGGPSATVQDTGTLTVASGGSVTASAVSLTANDIAIAGLVSDGGGGTTSLIATTGTISETGTLVAGTLSGSSAGTTSLTGATSTTNQIADLGTFTAQGFTLDDGIGLTVSGVLNGGPSATVLDAGTLTIGNTVTAAAIALTADSISIPGLVSDGGGGTTSLIATTGTISETGTLVAGTLSGSSAGTTSLSGATSTTNQIASLGTFTAQGFTLADGIGLTVSGAVNGGPSATVLDAGTLTVASGGSVRASAVSLTANDIAIAGLVSNGGGGTTSLIATTGTISETGTLVAGTLSGSSAGDASLTGSSAASNRVTQLGGFSSGGTFSLRDGADLTVTGPLTAPTIVIDVGANRITLADRAVITTGGIQRPFGTIANSAFPDGRIPLPRPSTQGAYLTTGGGFTQQGSSTVQGIGGSPNILRINATGSANIAFDPFVGLQGPNTWLILQIGTGRATGQVHVRNLDVISQGGLAGASDLTGSVTGLTGPAAAGAAGIVPNPNSNFRFNQCAIQSVSCILLPGEAVPTANPLNDINIGTLFNPNEDEDLLLPIVSDQDY